MYMHESTIDIMDASSLGMAASAIDFKRLCPAGEEAGPSKDAAAADSLAAPSGNRFQRICTCTHARVHTNTHTVKEPLGITDTLN